MFSLQSEWRLPTHFRGFRTDPGQAQSYGLWEADQQACSSAKGYCFLRSSAGQGPAPDTSALGAPCHSAKMAAQRLQEMEFGVGQHSFSCQRGGRLQKQSV